MEAVNRFHIPNSNERFFDERDNIREDLDGFAAELQDEIAEAVQYSLELENVLLKNQHFVKWNYLCKQELHRR